MFCSKCGRNLPEGSQFCLKCGQPVVPTAGGDVPALGANAFSCAACGTAVPADSQFCLKCGQPVSATPIPLSLATRLATASRVARPRPRSRLRIALWFLLPLLLVAGIIWWATTSDDPRVQQLQALFTRPHTETIIDAPFSVKARDFVSYKFTVPVGATGAVLTGQFSATSAAGQEHDVMVYVLADEAFASWRNGYTTSNYYDSGRVAQGSLKASLPSRAGIYYLLFDNRFSPRTVKLVQSSVTLSYNRWWPPL